MIFCTTLDHRRIRCVRIALFSEMWPQKLLLVIYSSHHPAEILSFFATFPVFHSRPSAFGQIEIMFRRLLQLSANSRAHPLHTPSHYDFVSSSVRCTLFQVHTYFSLRRFFHCEPPNFNHIPPHASSLQFLLFPFVFSLRRSSQASLPRCAFILLPLLSSFVQIVVFTLPHHFWRPRCFQHMHLGSSLQYRINSMIHKWRDEVLCDCSSQQEIEPMFSLVASNGSVDWLHAV